MSALNKDALAKAGRAIAVVIDKRHGGDGEIHNGWDSEVRLPEAEAAILAYTAALPALDGVVERLLSEIEAGLEGVTPGPWSWGAKFISRKDPAENYTPFAECLPGDYDTPQWEANAAHLSRLSPDNVRLILDHITALTARLAAAEQALLTESRIVGNISSSAILEEGGEGT